MTTETAEDTTTTTDPVDLDTLRKAVSTAKTAHTKAEKAAGEARTRDDVDFDALMALMDNVKSSTRTLAKAENAVTKAEFEAGAAERSEVVDSIRGELQAIVGLNLDAITRTKIRGFSIRIDDEGGIEIDATVPNAPKRAGGGGRGRTKWTLDGADYTSKEFLEQVGVKTEGFDIPAIMDKAANGAGFDAHVKRLAKVTGATGTKTDGSTVDVG